MTKSVIIVGDSHVGALHAAFGPFITENAGSRLRDNLHFMIPDVGNVSRQLMLGLDDGSRILNPVMTKELDQPYHAKTPRVLNRWNGYSPLSERPHELIFLWGFAEMHTFAFETAWQEYGINNDVQHNQCPDRAVVAKNPLVVPYLVPRALVRDVLEIFLSPIFEAIGFLREKGIVISTICGPPPIPDTDYIRQHFPAFSPPDQFTSLAIYQLMLDIYRTKANAGGYRFYDFSKNASDECGFRLEKYWGDGIHGNYAYGFEMLRLLEDALFPELAGANERSGSNATT